MESHMFQYNCNVPRNSSIYEQLMQSKNKCQNSFLFIHLFCLDLRQYVSTCAKMVFMNLMQCNFQLFKCVRLAISVVSTMILSSFSRLSAIFTVRHRTSTCFHLIGFKNIKINSTTGFRYYQVSTK